jgi:hypothetical protein
VHAESAGRCGIGQIEVEVEDVDESEISGEELAEGGEYKPQ